MLYRGSGADGGMAHRARRAKRGTAIHWRVLDSSIGNTARARPGSLSSQRTAYQELAWPQERHRGMSVVAEAAHVRTTKQQLPAERPDPYGANPVAPQGRIGGANQ